MAIGKENFSEMPELLTLLQGIPVGKNNGLFIANNLVKEDPGVPNMKV